MLAAGVILTCMVIGVGFYIAREAQSTAQASSNQLSEYKKDIEESGYIKYDGMSVSGSDVVNFAKKNLSSYDSDNVAPVYVSIKTSLHDETYETNNYLKSLRDFTNQRYVNPVNMFEGTVIRDENEVIVGVIFTEK
jgi:hypothetical protein